MANNQHKLNREERLAAKLRENLRRRKAQARAFESSPHPTEESTGNAADDSAAGALPKDGGKS